MTELLELRDLKRVIDAIFDHMLDELKIERVAIDTGVDLYWEVPSAALYDVKANLPELSIGRLSDDWEFLRRILTNSDEALAIMLTHAAPLLRHVGEKIGQ